MACVDPSLTPHEVEDLADDSVATKESSDEDSLDDSTQVDTVVVAKSNLEKNALKVDNLGESEEVDDPSKPEKEEESSSKSNSFR